MTLDQRGNDTLSTLSEVVQEPAGPIMRNKIDANPTKALFIFMLTKDIGFIRSIINLVDNSIDGARRLRGAGRLDGLWIRLEVDADCFRICDNCGGMRTEIARQYAFRFGRVAGAPLAEYSVGQFGIGMKCALFKLGRNIEIQSTTDNSRFAISIDIGEWQRHDRWEFEFDRLEEGIPATRPEERGTDITVTSLYEDVAELLNLENFRNQLVQELQEAHLHSLNMGLAITVDTVPLTVRPLRLLRSDQLQPAYREFSLNSTQRETVHVKLYAGIGEHDTHAAGWYVFCNGRLLLAADQSQITGWDDDEGVTVAKYHNDYACFRGYAFFDADDASLLPWNTTKTGVDFDSQRYRAARLEMKKTMQPILTFCRNMSKDKSGAAQTDDGPLESVVKSAQAIELSAIDTPQQFVSPEIKSSRPKNTGRMQYDRPIELVDKVKKRLKVSTLREVGERTFDYYFREECDG